MNKVITSRESILESSKQLAISEGLSALNMRRVAKESGIAVGTVYNYFPTKGDLVTATVQSVWEEIMEPIRHFKTDLGFVERVRLFYEIIQKGSDKYPSFFSVHAMQFASREKEQGRQTMNRFILHVKLTFKEALINDPNLKEDVFTETFTLEGFIDFVFDNMIYMLMRHVKQCDYLLEVIKRTVLNVNV